MMYAFRSISFLIFKLITNFAYIEILFFHLSVTNFVANHTNRFRPMDKLIHVSLLFIDEPVSYGVDLFLAARTLLFLGFFEPMSDASVAVLMITWIKLTSLEFRNLLKTNHAFWLLFQRNIWKRCRDCYLFLVNIVKRSFLCGGFRICFFLLLILERFSRLLWQRANIKFILPHLFKNYNFKIFWFGRQKTKKERGQEYTKRRNYKGVTCTKWLWKRFTEEWA